MVQGKSHHEPESRYQEIGISTTCDVDIQVTTGNKTSSKGNKISSYIGIQVLTKLTCSDVGVQCSTLTTTHASMPKKEVSSHLPLSDSDVSDKEVDEQHHNQSCILSSESCLS